jgi:Uma2 family endonuclease
MAALPSSSVTPAITLEDFARLPRQGARHEIDAGELLTLPPPKSRHALIALTVLESLQQYLKQRDTHRALPEAGFILSRDPLTIRQPDVSVISRERIRATSADSYFEGAPELAVEIVSPSDSAEDLDSKIRQYLESGAEQVWIIYPKTRTVHVFSPGAAPRIVTEDQTLDYGVAVGALFAV